MVAVPTPVIEIITNNGIVEIRYFDLPDDIFYRSWKMPEAITGELVSVWHAARQDIEASRFPIEITTKLCKIAIRRQYVEVKSLDGLGRPTMHGWNLPRDVLEKHVFFSSR